MSSAAFFDHLYATAPHYYGLAVRAEYLAFISDISGQRLLDLGCGQGRHAIAAARRGASVHAIDQSAEAIRQLSVHGERYGLTIDATVAKIETLELTEYEYDRAVLVTCLDHIAPTHIPRVEDVLWQALKPGGRIYVEVFTIEDAGQHLHTDRSETAEPVRHYFGLGELRSFFARWKIDQYQEFAEWDTSHGALHLHGIALMVASRC